MRRVRLSACVSGYAARNAGPFISLFFVDVAVHGGGTGFACLPGMKLLIASIVLSVLVLWALGCGLHG